MTQPRRGAEYGLAFLYNALPVGDPRCTETFAQHNRLGDDTAQLTRPAIRGWVLFPTSVAGPGVIAAGISGKSQMGIANTNLPVVTKTGTGLYTIVYPASWTDGAGTDSTGVGQVEAIILLVASGNVQSVATKGVVQCSALNQTISVLVMDTTFTASDLGGAVPIYVECRS